MATYQPNFGTIELTGRLTESLDEDLIIGRDPEQQPLMPRQRAVAHGVDDRTVSRRQVELKLDGCSVSVVSLGSHTRLRRYDGTVSELEAGISSRFDPGDTLHYGSGLSLRYAIAGFVQSDTRSDPSQCHVGTNADMADHPYESADEDQRRSRPVPRPETRVRPVERSQAVLAWGASSVVGLRRRSNQDRCFQHGPTFGVADGMGGLPGGAEASNSAVESVVRRVAALEVGAPLTKWESMVRSVNEDTRNRLEALGLRGAGCTLTLATVEPGRVVVAHVGDSRLYDLEPRTGLLHQRTSDHNLRNELQARGRSLQEAVEEGLPPAGLVSYIGMPDENLTVDVLSWSPAFGTRLLLCSDGVHGYLPHAEMADVVATFAARDAATELTQRADAAGGRDNSTAIVVELP